MKKICFVFNSRNNYHLFDCIFYKMSECDVFDYPIFNIDIDSTDEQKKIGKSICEKYGIINIDMDNDPLKISVPRTMERVFDYIEENNLDIDWVMWWSHDNYILGEDFLERMENFIYNNDENINEKVGAIGFAVKDIVEKDLWCYGRGSLIKNIFSKNRRGWYIDISKEYLEKEYFLVESTCFTSIALNRKLYRKYIKPDYNFKLYCWGDDISYQFMKNNIASITIPSLKIVDGWRIKPIFGVCRAYDSFLNKSNYFHLDISMDHWKHWYEKWNFTFSREQCREEYIKQCKEQYRDTLIDLIYNLDVEGNPITLEEIGERYEKK